MGINNLRTLLEHVEAFKKKGKTNPSDKLNNRITSRLDMRMQEQDTFLELLWDGLFAFYLPKQVQKLCEEAESELEPTTKRSAAATLTLSSEVVKRTFLVLFNPKKMSNGIEAVKTLAEIHAEMCVFQQQDKFYLVRIQKLEAMGSQDARVTEVTHQLISNEVIREQIVEKFKYLYSDKLFNINWLH